MKSERLRQERLRRGISRPAARTFDFRKPRSGFFLNGYLFTVSCKLLFPHPPRSAALTTVMS